MRAAARCCPARPADPAPGPVLADPLTIALACLGVFVAGISKAGFGSGASFLAAPLLAMVVEPAVALAVLLPVLMVIDLSTLRPYWKRWHAGAARLLCLGALPGVALGALIYRASDPDVIRFLIGAIALGFVALQLWRNAGGGAGGGRAPRWLGLTAGCVGGFTSFVSHAGGPPVTIYLLHRGLTKTEFQATTVLVFWLVNIAKAGPYAALGLFDAHLLAAAAALVPVALLGAWIGVHAHRIASERLFFAITYVLLTVAGAKLIYDALA